MITARLERIDGDYIVRIPRDEIVQRDLREGQWLAVLLEALDEFDEMGADRLEAFTKGWKLNEAAQRYRTDP